MSVFQDTDGEQGFDKARIERHVRNLLRTPGYWDRSAYLGELERKEGAIIARHVSDEYARARGLLQEGAR